MAEVANDCNDWRLRKDLALLSKVSTGDAMVTVKIKERKREKGWWWVSGEGSNNTCGLFS